MKLRLLLAGFLASFLAFDAGSDVDDEHGRPLPEPALQAVPSSAHERQSEPLLGPQGRATAPLPSGYRARGEHFYVWDEDRSFVSDWADALSSSEPTLRRSPPRS